MQHKFSSSLRESILGMGVVEGKNYEDVRELRIVVAGCPYMKSIGPKRRLLRYWTYFRRGHSVYLIFAITFLNFVVIQWRLLIEQIKPLEALFQHFSLFAILLLATYIPLATIIGWTDYKRGAMPVDQTVAASVNPWVQDLAKAMLLLAEGKNEEVVELMKKWAGK